MTAPIDRELLAGFIAEVRGYLPRIRAGVDAWRGGAEAGAALEEAHRFTHSIKGAAAMVGLGVLSQIANLLEEALEDAAAGDLEPGREAAGALGAAADQVEGYLDGLAAGRPAERAHLGAAVTALRRLRGLPEEGDAEEIERLLGAAPAPPVAAGPRTGRRPEPPAGEGAGEPAPAAEEPAPELVEAFRDEAEDHLRTVAGALERLRHGDGGGETLGEIRRAVHTLKGAAALVGRRAVAGLAHRMEDLLERMAAGAVPVGEEPIALLLDTTDALDDGVSGAGAGAGDPSLEERYRELLGEDELPPEIAGEGLFAPLGEEPPLDVAALAAVAPAAGAGTARRAEAATSGRVVRVPIERLDELVRLVSELVVNRSAFEQSHGELARELGELDLSLGRVRRIAGRLEAGYEVLALGAGAAAHAAAAATGRPSAVQDFDELEFDRYTELHLVSRELTETGSDLGAVGGELAVTVGDFDGCLTRLSRLTTEVQDKLMRLRMVPLAQLATRLQRAVRVTAGQQGKSARLVLEGGEVELDKTVLEEIADPLLHLMRNAVDHGLEPPELRRVVGKPERGTVHLSAAHEGTQVVLRIADDGAGIQPEQVRAAAVAGGYLSDEEAAGLADGELYPLLFAPGFTTAGAVSEVSGRGVGLDVVKATVARLEGTIAVDSEPGRGTTVTIRLPVTLAITRVLMVAAGGEVFALPLGMVSQLARFDRGEIEQLGREPVVRLDGRVYPLIFLERALGLARALGLPEPAEEPPARVPVLTVDLGERRLALAVDRLIEAREVVVKPLGTLLRRVRGVSGATLTGDGSVVLILAPGELAADPAAAEPTLPARLERRLGRRALDVLIVDDSLSVRRVLANLVRGAGWNPVAARDGVEALEILQRSARLPDVVLLDIEMPRMDGYELAATIQSQPSLAGLPIVFITSRAGEKHRARAFELGASEYLVKPYPDAVLLDAIRRLAARPRPEAAAS
jgi:chemosensory pili system protein ChpA (sensor histidine kinase/response regulator)